MRIKKISKIFYSLRSLVKEKSCDPLEYWKNSGILYMLNLIFKYIYYSFLPSSSLPSCLGSHLWVNCKSSAHFSLTQVYQDIQFMIFEFKKRHPPELQVTLRRTQNFIVHQLRYLSEERLMISLYFISYLMAHLHECIQC